MKFNEQYTIENYIIKFVKDKLNYEYIKPEEFAKLRDLESEYIITPLLEKAVSKLNPTVTESEIKNVIREVRKIDNNEAFLKALRDGINLKNSVTGKKHDYKLLDFDTPENNQFVVNNQFYFEGDTENIRPDILILVNGLPLVDIEAKSPTASEGVSFENGIDQLKRYEKVARKLFIPNCFNIATDGLKTVYGATCAPKQYFLEWRDPDFAKATSGKEDSHDTSLQITLTSLLSKVNFLDIIQNFILFKKEKKRFWRKRARHH